MLLPHGLPRLDPGLTEVAAILLPGGGDGGRVMTLPCLLVGSPQPARFGTAGAGSGASAGGSCAAAGSAWLGYRGHTLAFLWLFADPERPFFRTFTIHQPFPCAVAKRACGRQ